MRHFLLLFLLALMILPAVAACGQEEEDQNATQPSALVDDWEYTGPPPVMEDGIQPMVMSKGGGPMVGAPAPMMAAPMAEAEALGFSVGGAKDVGNFRENIEAGYLPLPTDLTYEGLFYDYYFDTGQQEPCQALFCPSYSLAVSPDPFSGEEQYYLSVGLNSNLTTETFARKKLKLVVVLDISGSMGSPFDEYYYDDPERHDNEDPDVGLTKMELADKAVTLLMDHLRPGDSFGVVLFDDAAYLAKRMNPVEATDMEAIKKHVLEIYEQGGTNMEAGMRLGSKLYDDIGQFDQSEYEYRIIFLTDAMPNLGDISDKGLLGMMDRNAKRGVYTTFIGIGVDFNTELIEAISKVTGANYYSVHSAAEFKTRMDDEFEFMVTPLVFDLSLAVKADGFDIKRVYGSPQADLATGELMHVSTLFPSRTEEGETRGGLVLLQLEKTSEDASLTLSATYKDRDHQDGGESKDIVFKTDGEEYANTGIRKGILLTRYANLMKNWMEYERSKPGEDPEQVIRVYEGDGIPLPPLYELGEWERTSMDLAVAPQYKRLFTLFKGYMEKEAKLIGDETLLQEVDILDNLIKTGS